MNTQPLAVRPDVEQFVAAVRSHFADLPAEEVDDLLIGLEADVSDRVAEEGAAALGDPAVYAAELRAAAGLPAAGETRAARLGGFAPGPWVIGVLDAGAARWARLLDALPADVGGIARAARPGWWVLRAWIAMLLGSHLLWSPYHNDVAWLPTPRVALGLPVLLVAIAVSVQIGRGRLWPGTRSAFARVVLIGLNVFAVAVLPTVLQDMRYGIEEQAYSRMGSSVADPVTDGLFLNGRQICNLQPYDAAGRPLTGVQLFDGGGRPFDINCTTRAVTSYPWMLGDVARYNVFPQAERRQSDWGAVEPGAYDSARPPAFPVPSRPEVPAVTHPLLPEKTTEATQEDENGKKSNKKAGEKPKNRP